MVRHIKILVEDKVHEDMVKLKGDHTWYEVFIAGIEALQNKGA